MVQAQLTAFERDLAELIRARHPIILVESSEPGRVLDTLTGLVAKPVFSQPRQVLDYTLTKGLHRPGGPAEKRVLPEVALTQAMAMSDPTIFVFFDLHHQLGDGGRPVEPTLVRLLLDVAYAFKTGPVPHTLVIIAPSLTLPADLETVVTILDLPLPEPTDLDNVLQGIIDVNRDAIDIDLAPEDRPRLVQAAQGLTLWEADNAFARAILDDRRLSIDDIPTIIAEKRQIIRKSGLLELIDPPGTLDDIGGLENLKHWLVKRQGSWLPEAAEWSVPTPKGVLITGVPGCGKSLTASCVAAQWKLPLLRFDLGKVFSRWVGGSEHNMRQALKLAEAVAPSVLWIDEIEKGLGGGGSNAGDSGTSRRVFGNFLTWMQEKTKPVFVIATANDIASLPPEFMRKGRFDEIFFIDLPTHTERAEIWCLHLGRSLAPPSKAGGAVPLDAATFAWLADISEGFSGAEIAQAVADACVEAFDERRPVSRDDLTRVIENTVPLSVTQSESIRALREWAETRAVAATADDAREAYASASTDGSGDDVASWRGGRAVEF